MSTILKSGVAALVCLITVLVAGASFAASVENPRVLVLPFEVNAGDDLAYLEESLPDLIAQRLMEQGIDVVPPAQVFQLLREQEITELTLDTAKKLALLGNANYALYGSFNQIGETVSIDARVVDAFGMQAAKPLYISKEGLINILPALDELVANVRNEVLRKQTISKITVKGTKVLDSDVVLMRLATRKGDSLDPQKINEEIKRIFDLGYFSDVRISAEQTREGLELLVEVDEKPRIENITIEGSDEVDVEDIRAAMSTKEGGVLNEKVLAQDLQKVLMMYRKEGFYLAKVDHRVEGSGHVANLVLSVVEGEKLYIKQVVIKGAEQLDEDDVLDQLQLSERGMFSWFTGSGVLEETKLEQDSASIGAYYVNRGFMDVRVAEPEVAYEEDGIVVTYKVDEGVRYKIGEISFAGELIEPDERFLEIIKLDEWKEDEVYVSYAVLKDDVNKLAEHYSSYGYAYADVDFKYDRVSEGVMNITFDIEKNRKLYVRRVYLEGNTRTRDNVVRREMELTDGDRFDGLKLQKSNKNLSGLGYFSESDIQIVPTENENEVDLKVKVTEKATGALAAGVGWSSYNGIGFGGSISEGNLWGKGYYLALSGTFGGDYTRYNLDFNNPHYNDTDLSIGGSSYYTTNEYDDYSVDRIGAAIRFGHPFGNYSRLHWGYTYEWYDVYEVDEDASDTIKDDKGINTSSSVWAGISRNTVEMEEGHPVSGTYASLTATYGGDILMGDDDFIKFVQEIKGYYALNNDHVLMGRVKTGQLMKSLGGEEVPLVERFRVGGIDSVRGYKSSDFAVREKADGDKTGGTLMGYANLEYQWFFNKEFGMVLVPFFDIGFNHETERSLDEYEHEDYLASTGLELRWKSPLGDLRFAYGYPLTKVDGETKEPRFEFAMGQTF